MRWRTLLTKINVSCKRCFKSSSQSLKSASLYVHWPFCNKICPYCDFNKYVRDAIDHDGMGRCLQIELKSLLKMYDIDEITSIYFGGGTPSLAVPHTLEKIIDTVTKQCRWNKNREITLEVNPTFLELNKLRDFRSIGINRVSIGVQALSDPDLKLLGREHSVDDSLRCIAEATMLFNGRVSIDLMFARPKQTCDKWRDELQQVILLECSHVSLYQLTMKQGTVMEKNHKRGKLRLPTDDECAIMYEDAIEGFESQHNLSYWNGGDYIGIGPGYCNKDPNELCVPNSCDNEKHALVNVPVPEHWVQQVTERGHGVRKSTLLSPQERTEEMLMLSLRKNAGLPCNIFESIIGWSPHRLNENNRLQELIRTKYLIIKEDGCLQVTTKGMMVLDLILPEITCAVEEITSKLRGVNGTLWHGP